MGPAEICAERLNSRYTEYKHLKRKHRLLGNARLAGAAVGLAVLWSVETYLPGLTWYAAALLLGGFIYSSVRFSRIESAIFDTGNAVVLYADPVYGFRRNEGPGQTAKDLPVEADHPFSLDVDVVQPDGLFDRVNTAATRTGMQELAKLLSEPVETAVIRDRQAVVKELKSQLDLREDFYLTGLRKVRCIRTDGMLGWASKKAAPVPRWVPAGCLALSSVTLAAAVAAALGTSPLLAGGFGAALLAEYLFWRGISAHRKVPSLEAERFHVDFAELLALVRLLEKQDFEAPLLRQVTQALQSDSGSATQALQRFRRVIAMYEARRNHFVGIFGPLILYETQLALAVERWRAEWSAQLPRWIKALAMFEAYSSVACYAFEHPMHTFPELVDEGPTFRAENLAHPLLGENAVSNSVTLDRERPILVISGANMAGKSTLLRSIGINLALAYAGAPVRSKSMSMSSLAVVASIRVTDSLKAGESRFAAELKRIRLMLDRIRSGIPTLVLIDELFGGTNSYDRYTGAVSLAEYILCLDSALAVLSTHDRNITRWAERNSARIANAHFADVFSEGDMKFDYKLREGPATKGNALELMRLAGLPIREQGVPPTT